MNLTSIITYALIGFVVVFIVNYMNNASNKSILTDDKHSYLLRINIVYLILGIASLFISVLLIATSLILRDQNSYILFGVMALFFAIMGTPFILLYKNHKLTFDKEGFMVTNWRGKNTSFNWDEVKHIKNGPLSGYITITENDKSVKIHKHLSGLLSFLIYLENATKWTTKGLNQPFQKNG